MSKARSSGAKSAQTLRLDHFFPYRLAVLAETVSREVARVYTDRFDLSRDEWRVLAALGERGPTMSQSDLLYTTLDKVQVSRALVRMERNGLLKRTSHERDRRNRIVALTVKGKSVYRRLVPQVREVEATILQALSANEQSGLNTCIDKVLSRIETLNDLD